MLLGDAQICVSLSTIFQYLIFINQDNFPEWVVAIKSVSVIWGSSTLLNVRSMKNLVSSKLFNIDKTSVY